MFFRRSPEDGFEKAAWGGDLKIGWHRDIGRILSTWREVVKVSVAPDSCSKQLLVFLRQTLHGAA